MRAYLGYVRGISLSNHFMCYFYINKVVLGFKLKRISGVIKIQYQ